MASAAEHRLNMRLLLFEPVTAREPCTQCGLFIIHRMRRICPFGGA
jgi:hypothetical protein